MKHSRIQLKQGTSNKFYRHLLSRNHALTTPNNQISFTLKENKQIFIIEEIFTNKVIYVMKV